MKEIENEQDDWSDDSSDSDEDQEYEQALQHSMAGWKSSLSDLYEQGYTFTCPIMTSTSPDLPRRSAPPRSTLNPEAPAWHPRLIGAAHPSTDDSMKDHITQLCHTGQIGIRAARRAISTSVDVG